MKLRREKSTPKPKEPKHEKVPKPKKERTPKEPRPKRTQAPKSSLRGGRKKQFIFFIGDEGTILVLLEGKSVTRRIYAPAADAENIMAFQDLLESAPDAPIYALVDMIDQSYMKQTLPPVAKLSVQKLIKRRLERDFGPEDITGALLLGREDGGRKDWNYMLISLSGSPQLLQWLDFILELPNPFEGIHLVPVESLSFLNAISQKKFGREKSSWQLLVCHNKVGGFRQVIFKDGKLTFTRLAQPIGDSSPEVVAGSVEQEIGNTIEYLKRLSYTDDQGLDCLVVVSAEIKQYIEPVKIKARNVSLLTPFEVNEILGFDRAALPEDHYADVIFSAAFGLLSEKILALHSKYSQQLLTLRKARLGTIAAAAMVILVIGGYGTTTLFDTLPKLDEIQMLEKQVAQLSSDARPDELLKKLPPDIDRMDDVVTINNVFSENKNEIIEFILAFRSTSYGTVVVNRLTWKNSNSLTDRFSKALPNLAIDMDVQFVNSGGSIDEFSGRAKEFLSRVKAAYPGFIVTSSKLPGILDQEQSFETKFNDTANKSNQGMMSGEPVVISLTFSSKQPEPPPPY